MSDSNKTVSKMTASEKAVAKKEVCSGDQLVHDSGLD